MAVSRYAWWSILLVGLLSACAPNDNRDPKLLGIENQTLDVNVPAHVNLYATDPDGDDLTFTFELSPEPATQTQSAGGKPTINKLGTGNAVFQWTPGIADAGPADQMAYELTIKVDDGNGGQDQETIQVLVVNGGLGPVGLAFVEPPGAGMAIDLNQTACIDGMPVSVKADLVPDSEVELNLGQPAPSGANLFPPGPGKRKSLSWCPTAEDLDRSLAHTLVFEARRLNDDQPVVKRFLVRFKRNAGANCPGAPPEIEHAPPGSFGGPLNYELVATITDDVGFKSPPILAFTTEPPSGSGMVDTSGWQVVEMVAEGESGWRASVPNLNLADGETATVSYVITATDNDDPDGTSCDHSTESEVFQFTATGGGASGGQTYGDCAPCVADAQCGGEKDLCVPLLGEFFCAHACSGGGCQAGTSCVQITSIDGVTDYQCIPEDANCGQICTADAYEGAAGNNDPTTATPVEMGSSPELTICDQDVDYFKVAVTAGQSIVVSATFDNMSGDLDLFMNLPGDPSDEYPYQSANADEDVESVQEPCVPMDGDAYIAVVPYQDARNLYQLDVATGPGNCDVACTDDRHDDVASGNDTAADFTLVDQFPYDETNLVVCRLDPDFYGFDVRAGEILRAGIYFSHRDGDLDLRLYASGGQLVAESRSYRDVELVELEVPGDDVYVLEVFGVTRSVMNGYELVLEKLDTANCQVTLQCPGGLYCDNGQCVDAVCNHSGGCGGGAACVAPQACRDPAAFENSSLCADTCQSSFECRTELGYACKRFEDYTTGCLPAGGGRTGDRCLGHQDCEGTDICLPLEGGYCATGGCAGDDCPEGTVCALVPAETCAGEVFACLKACEGPEDCRAGLSCQPVDGGMACLP